MKADWCYYCGEITTSSVPTRDTNYTDRGTETRYYEMPVCGECWQIHDLGDKHD